MKTFKIFLEEYSGLPSDYGTPNDPRLDVSKPYRMAQDDPELAEIIRTGADDPSTLGDDGLTDSEWRQKRAEEVRFRAQTGSNPKMVNIAPKGEPEEFVEVPRDASGNFDESNIMKNQQNIADILGISKQSVSEMEGKAIDKLRKGMQNDPEIKNLLMQLASENEARRTKKSNMSTRTQSR